MAIRIGDWVGVKRSDRSVQLGRVLPPDARYLSPRQSAEGFILVRTGGQHSGSSIVRRVKLGRSVWAIDGRHPDAPVSHDGRIRRFRGGGGVVPSVRMTLMDDTKYVKHVPWLMQTAATTSPPTARKTGGTESRSDRTLLQYLRRDRKQNGPLHMSTAVALLRVWDRSKRRALNRINLAYRYGFISSRMRNALVVLLAKKNSRSGGVQCVRTRWIASDGIINPDYYMQQRCQAANGRACMKDGAEWIPVGCDMRFQ